MVGTQSVNRPKGDTRPGRPGPRPNAPSGRVLRRLAILVGSSGLLLLFLLLALAYGLDAHGHKGRVARGVHLAGTDVGGKTPKALDGILANLDRTLGDAEVIVKLPSGASFTSNGHDMGLHLDEAATRAKVLAVGKHDSLPGRVFGWIETRLFGVHRRAALGVAADEGSIARTVALETGFPSAPPVEPTIAVGDDGRLHGRPGRPGTGIDVADLARNLPKAAAKGIPIRVSAQDGTTNPRFTVAEADAVAAQAETLVHAPLIVRSGTASGLLSTATLRTLFIARPAGSTLEIGVDESAAAGAASQVLSAAGTPGHDATFDVQADGSVTIGPAATGTGCCDAAAGHLIAQALLGERPSGGLDLPLTSTPPRITEELARTLGIKEQIGTFTTKYIPGQPRVTNIHRIADLVRGQVILPGQAFSVNDFIGPRTLDKGFVVDHVIEDGVFSEAVGGGISQFATTLFNAAWFGGLDFDEYQSHSIYISRYPYGRDATLNFTHPDLKLQNTTPYGVLLWPTYSDNSVTVTLYSTRFAAGTMTGQDKNPVGSCTRVVSHRLRTYVDGHTATDDTYATYQAAEGQPCTASAPIPTIPCPIDQRPCPVASTTTAAPSVSTSTTKKGATTTVAPSPPASTTPTTKAGG